MAGTERMGTGDVTGGREDGRQMERERETESQVDHERALRESG